MSDDVYGSLHDGGCYRDDQGEIVCGCVPLLVRDRASGIEQKCDNEGSVRSRGISTPDAQSHIIGLAPVAPADPRSGRGAVIRGSVE